MGHLLKYKVIKTLRQRESMFWSLLFPIILGTLFYFSFGNPDADVEELQKIPVAVIEQEACERSTTFRAFLDEMDGDVLKVKEMSESKAKKALTAGDIIGIYYTGETQSLTVSANDLKESILKSLLDSYNKNEATVMDIMEHHPENLQKAMKTMSDYQELTKEISLGGRTMDSNVSYFFALIAMACLYGAFIGLESAVELQANLSSLGARRSVTPTHRMKLVVCDMLSIFGIHFVNIMILLAYLKWVLKINFGNEFGGMAVVCLFGSLFGVSLGMLIGNIGKKSMGIKVGILIGSTMICSFLSGLMVGNMKDIIEHHAPIINRINPAALIADAFYCLNVYDDMGRYTRNLATLGAMAVVFAILSYAVVRRERYDSI